MYILIDIGGTKMRLASAFDRENLSQIETHTTPPDFDKALEIIRSFVAMTDSKRTDKLVCCGLPGVLDKDKKMLLTAPNLPDWAHKPIKLKLSKIVNAPTYLENDTTLAGLGEAIRGKGAGHSIIAFLAFGTGVGGVRIVDGNIDRSTLGFEPGHQIIDADGSIAGRITDWEGLVSGAGMEARFGKKPEDIKDEKIWQSVEHHVAIGLTNTILHWSPDIVVLGGSLIRNEFISIERIKAYISEVLKVFPVIPDIVVGSLGDAAALHGGLIYLQQKV